MTVNDLTKSIDKKRQTDGILLHFTKAPDNVTVSSDTQTKSL